MSLYQLVNDNARIAESGVRQLEGRFKRLEKDLLKRLLEYIRQLPTSGGRIVMDETSTRVLNQLNGVLAESLRSTEIRDAIRDLLPEFDRISSNISIMHGDESGIRVPQSLMNDTKNRMVMMTGDSILSSGYNARFVDPVRKVLFNHVNFGAGILDTEKALRALIAPQDGSGALTKYVGGVARDSFHQFEGQVHRQIAEIHQLKNWRYVGNILPGAPGKDGKRVGGTRPQCRRWVEKEIILGAELPDEIRWARNNGSGWIPGTTVETWPINRGGYNCRHKAIPTRRGESGSPTQPRTQQPTQQPPQSPPQQQQPQVPQQVQGPQTPPVSPQIQAPQTQRMSRAEVIDTLAAHAKSQSTERRIITNQSGEVLVDQVGQMDRVDLQAEGQNRAFVTGENLIDSHNHPDESSFSDGDWKTFSWGSVAEMNVVTPSGVVYTLRKTDKWNSMDWSKRTPKVVEDRWNELSNRDLTGKSVVETIYDINVQMAEEFGVFFERRELRPSKKRPQMNKEAYLTTPNEEYNAAYAEALAQQDGIVDIMLKRNTIHGFLMPRKELSSSSIKAQVQKVNPNATTRTRLGKDNGFATYSQSVVVTRLQDGHKVEAKGYGKEMAEFQEDAAKWVEKYAQGRLDSNGIIRGAGYALGKVVNGKPKMWSASTIGRITDKNVIGTVTHENAHIIHFEYDKPVQIARKKFQPMEMAKLAREKGITLNDAPTLYGQTNWMEFWSESFACYVHMPEWFKKEYPKAHNFFEQMLETYKIDKTTIKQYR